MMCAVVIPRISRNLTMVLCTVDDLAMATPKVAINSGRITVFFLI